MTEHNIHKVLKQWQDTDPGRYASRWEYRQVRSILTNVFGYHAIQIGMPHWDLLQYNRISNKWYAVEHTDLVGEKKNNIVVCESEQLPFDSESIDLIVLPHTLEMASNPHQVLREVQRVLVPEGHVLISGFNPWGLWGLRERVPGLECMLPVSPLEQLAPARVADWLSLLSFEVSAEVHGCFVPYSTQKKWIKRWQFLDKWGQKWWPWFGSVYVLVATKRVNSITMVGLDWSKRSARVRPRTAAVASREARLKAEQK